MQAGGTGTLQHYSTGLQEYTFLGGVMSVVGGFNSGGALFGAKRCACMWNPTTPPGLWRYGPWERLGFVKHSLGDTLEASYCTNDLIAFGTIIIAKGFTATDPRSCHWHTILKLKFKPSRRNPKHR